MPISTVEIIAVHTSDTGIDHSAPSSQRDTGSSSANKTPNTTSRSMDSIVDAAALPIACKKMKVALFTHAGISMHR